LLELLRELFMEDNDSLENEIFDFEKHQDDAVKEYRSVKKLYEDFAEVVRHILDEAIRSASIGVHSIEHRAKDIDGFGEKAARPSSLDPNRPEYENPLTDITDLAGVRVITFFPRDVEGVGKIIETEYVVCEKTDKGQDLADEGKFGYRSTHYIIKMTPERLALSEYHRFSGLTAEIQVRSILQHAWAEMEHDIQYKSATVIPLSIRRRFAAIAGLLEIADREFQTIQDLDKEIREAARQSVEVGNLDNIDITPDSLKSFLDKKMGSDGRMTRFSYEFTARILKKMGFSDLKQVDDCIKEYDDDRISRVIHGSRMGQITRFEDTLLAAMGENYAELHSWSSKWFVGYTNRHLNRLRAKGISIGSYTPESKDYSGTK